MVRLKLNIEDKREIVTNKRLTLTSVGISDEKTAGGR